MSLRIIWAGAGSGPRSQAQSGKRAHPSSSQSWAPATLTAIRGARETITFETYVYWSGEIGKEFFAAFCDRVKAGVKVHVMLDWAGSGKMEEKFSDNWIKVRALVVFQRRQL